MAIDSQKYFGVRGASSMKIKILKSTVCGGKNVKAGQTVDASDRDGRFLIARGKAEAIAKKEPAKKTDGES